MHLARHLLPLLPALLACGHALAQLSTYTTFYHQNWQMVNPAAIDRWEFFFGRNANSALIASGGIRNHWALAGPEDNPLNYFASFEMAPNANSGKLPLFKWGGTGFGERTGAFSMYGFFFNYSFYTQIKKGDFLHIGLNAGLLQRRIDKDQLRTATPNDATIENLDEDRLNADFALGLFYREQLNKHNRDMLYFGLSVPQIFNHAANQFAKPGKGTPVYLLLGALWDGGNANWDKFTFEPALWCRYASELTFYTHSTKNWQQVSLDGSVRAYYLDKFCVGMGYGSHMNAMLEVGTTFEVGTKQRFRFGLAYNFPAGRKYLNLGHSYELTLAYGRE